MLVKTANTDYLLPDSLSFLKPMLLAAIENQKVIGINHSFCYLTIRNGLVTSITDDDWHIDGFSTKINHIPEQNYIWTDILPTELVYKKLNIPKEYRF